MKITADMQIEDIIEEFPQTVAPMQDMGVQCMLCGEPVWGALKEKVEQKNLNLEKIIKELNKIIEAG